MVVTRRTPVPPAPTSRTPSAQHVPRVVKQSKDALNASTKSSPLVNGSHDPPLTSDGAPMDNTAGAPLTSGKLKGKPKAKKSAKKKSSGISTSFSELFFRMFLLWFTIYTLSVCPQDEQLKSPICRGLAEYRRLVIDPYIIPPIQQAVSHPSVAPYIEKAKPYADYVVRVAKPVAARAQRDFDAYVVPQWNKRMLPLYHKYAVPQLVRLDAQIAPYRKRIEHEYDRLLAPYVRRTAFAIYQWQHQARPYVVLAAEKSYRGYQVARPYARPLWEKIKAVLAQFAAFLGQQRRQFVDPHVRKIWEHAKELSNGKPHTPVATQLRSSATSQLSKASSQISKASANFSSTFSSVAASAMSGLSTTSSVAKVNPSSSASPDAVSSSEVPEAPLAVQTAKVVKPSVAVAPDEASPVISRPESDAFAISASVSPPLSAVVSDTNVASAADSVAHAILEDSASLLHSPSIVSPVAESDRANLRTSDNFSSTSSVTVTQAPPDSTASNPSSDMQVTVIPTPDIDTVDVLSDPDLDAFKAELGLTDDPSDSEPSLQEPLPVEPEISEEERLRVRQERAARERADIDRRHTAWEAQLAKQIEENKKAIRKTLVALRKTAAAELKDNREIRKEIEGLVQDAEKFLRGAEKYLVNLQKENRNVDDKRTHWDRVVGKVEEKFSDRLRATESVVNGWYMGKLQTEIEEVRKLTQEVKDIAERAQADIGLDYAYLDDVTYKDWQRYHDLLRTADKFVVFAETVRNGSHPSPPVNPVLPVIQELEDEVVDVISGFNARLRKVKRDGARAFGSPEEQSDEEDDKSASILPIEEPEQTESPVDNGVPPVVIGRGKAEVEAALNRAVDLEAKKTSSSNEPKKVLNADAVAQSLKDAVISEETSASSPLHQEL